MLKVLDCIGKLMNIIYGESKIISKKLLKNIEGKYYYIIFKSYLINNEMLSI